MNTKTIIVVLATLLIGSLCFWACQKDEIQQVKPVETENILLKAGHGGPMMLPFKGKGTYQYLAFVPDFEEMEIEITVVIEGTATQLGRFQGWITMLFDFILVNENPVPIGYLSHSSIFTAANGDELHHEGIAGPQGPIMEFSEPPGSGFSLTGIPIVGGTGRFENAVGEFVLLTSRDPYDPAPLGGTWEIEGEISFGKLAPFRGSGTYWYAGPPEVIEEIIDGEVVLVLVAVVGLEGRATRLGRFQGVETWRFIFDPEGPDGAFGDYLSHESKWIAANGDELHNEGSVEHGSVHEFYEPLGTGFSLTGVHIVGGTGRFENAVGWYDFWVNHTPGDIGGTWEFEGGISN